MTPDLITCPLCNGWGKVPDHREPPARPGWPATEVWGTCPHCHGARRVPPDPDGCPACGFRLSPWLTRHGYDVHIGCADDDAALPAAPRQSGHAAARTLAEPKRLAEVPTMSESDRLKGAALTAADRGWRVFPLLPGGKRPKPGFTAWERHATDDPDRIRRMWTDGEWNIGLACGPSGLVVVDLDTAKPGDQPPPAWAHVEGVTDGVDVFAVLAERAGVGFPANTYTVRTASGGTHLYFAAPPGPGLRNTAGRLGWLIDTRAVGGYVVAAGSTVNNTRYEIVNDLPAAPLPGWLATRLTAPHDSEATGPAAPGHAGYVRAALRGEVQRVLDAAPGTRNHTLNAAAYSLGTLVGGGLLARPVAEQALDTAAGLIGLTAREREATIRSGLDSGQRQPRTAA
jgi:hypothetical protein